MNSFITKSDQNLLYSVNYCYSQFQCTYLYNHKHPFSAAFLKGVRRRGCGVAVAVQCGARLPECRKERDFPKTLNLRFEPLSEEEEKALLKILRLDKIKKEKGYREEQG